MNVHISYKLRKTPDLEKEINHLVEKLRKRLQVFRPELLHLKAVVEQASPRKAVTVSSEPAPALGPVGGTALGPNGGGGDQDRVRRFAAADHPPQGPAAEFAQVDAAPVGQVPVGSAGPLRADSGVGSSIDRVR